MNDRRLTSITLKICIAVGISVTMIGLLASDTDTGTDILWLGILVLICSPFIGVLATFVALAIEKDPWVKAGAALIVIVLAGLFITSL
ncbi:MAG: hypothetical protein LBV63_01995 [Candidatus Methanoplasma sp.]|jgi:uncharacterized membrane protein|nr:hypothetical protein [Candidatus Methanoplasma sp.]